MGRCMTIPAPPLGVIFFASVAYAMRIDMHFFLRKPGMIYRNMYIIHAEILLICNANQNDALFAAVGGAARHRKIVCLLRPVEN